MIKSASSLSIADLEASPIWEFVNDDTCDETLVEPVEHLPVETFANRLVGTKITLANGQCCWALLGNIDETNPRKTAQFLTVGVLRDGQVFNLARYHDSDYEARGPGALATFLDLSTSDVFPISYDVRGLARAKTHALAGLVTQEPSERLSRAELIRLSVP